MGNFRNDCHKLRGQIDRDFISDYNVLFLQGYSVFDKITNNSSNLKTFQMLVFCLHNIFLSTMLNPVK